MKKKIAAVATLAAVLTLGAPAVAQARPVDPLTDVVRPWDIPIEDKNDWWCTYQRKHDGQSCVYIPGVHRPMPVQIREEVDVWWNIWSWF